jgi:hypothetical protein
MAELPLILTERLRRARNPVIEPPIGDESAAAAWNPLPHTVGGSAPMDSTLLEYQSEGAAFGPGMIPRPMPGAGLAGGNGQRALRDGAPLTPRPGSNNVLQSATRPENMPHCLPLYVLCQDLHGNKVMNEGKRCEDCHNMCLLNGYWPFWYCPLRRS